MIKWVACVIALLVLLPSHDAFGVVKYKDIGENHWAYAVICKAAEFGLMVGDAQGNFNPDAEVDMFDAARIIAKASGYNLTGATADQKTFYTYSYEHHKKLLDGLDLQFAKWKPTSNAEIAFLLERGLLTSDDINRFIVKDGTGEHINVISRQEFAAWLVRFIGADASEDEVSNNAFFLDDVDILPAYKPSVYYLLRKGIAGGYSDGTFKPEMAVTRASAANMTVGALVTLNAESEKPGGERSYAEGVVAEIHITGEKWNFSVKTQEGEVLSLNIDPKVFDIYSLRFGMKIKVAYEEGLVRDIKIL